MCRDFLAVQPLSGKVLQQVAPPLTITIDSTAPTKHTHDCTDEEAGNSSEDEYRTLAVIESPVWKRNCSLIKTAARVHSQINLWAAD